jgi:uncharacterized damage-inducible protein DinB
MTSKELLDSVTDRLAKLDDRAKAAFDNLTDEQANQPVPPSNWSSFQILDHLLKANAPYLDVLPAAIALAEANVTAEARFSWFGKFIAKAAGPMSSAPPPKAMIPDSGPMIRAKVDEYLAQGARIREILNSAKGKDLGTVRMNNPFVKILKLTLADVFEIFAQHTERHIGQIEAALPKGP